MMISVHVRNIWLSNLE